MACPAESDAGQMIADEAAESVHRPLSAEDEAIRALRMRTARREITERRRTAHRLRQAMQQDGLLLLYQPQIHLKSGLVRGAEAMLRLQHRRRGLILPQHFMPMAERSEVVNEIGAWVLNAAFQEAMSWPARLSVAVSFSHRQLQSGRLIKTVIDVLSRTGIPGERIEVQLTEAILAADDEDMAFNLKALRGLGMRLTADHFGMGKASLAVLKRMPVSMLKLDRSMVQAMGRDDGDVALVRAAIDAGHALGCMILADGVESEFQCRLLEELDCDEAQGAYFCPPVPAAEFLAKLNPD
jgi:EAL domain-containing protein (putative c-di-GMP-specific phosphodiesterase class I)